MEITFVSFLIMVIVFVTYISFIWLKYGIQTSISRSYYTLPPKLRILFTLFCWTFAMSAIVASVDVSLLMFGAGVGIGFVGTAAQLKYKLDYKVHMVAAVCAIVISQIAILIDFEMWYVNVATIILSIIMTCLSKKNYLWWVEIVSFLAICYAVGVTLIT